MSHDGGPAFAAIATSPSDDVFHQPGMSLRDYFAAAALQGHLAYSHYNESWGDYHNNGSDESLARRCYGFADAMLKARAALSKAEGVGQELAPDPERRVNGNTNGDEG